MGRERWAGRVIALALAAAASAPAASLAAPPPRSAARAADTVRVLVVGTSSVYCGLAPLLDAIASSRPGPVLRTTLLGRPWSTLRDHWWDASTRAAIESTRWDWVVLDEQSTLEESFFVDGRPRVDGWTTYARYARRLAQLAQAHGSRVALLSHWAGRDAPQRDQQALDYAVTSVAPRARATVAPVGAAWDAVRRSHPEVALYAADGQHASPAGSYLTAAVLYTTLTGMTPVGALDTVHAPMASRRLVVRSRAVLTALPSHDADVLQHAAWDQYRAFASGEVPGARRPAALTVPTLPAAGARPRLQELAGTWRGESTVYPTGGPVPTELWISQRDGRLTARIRVVLGPAPEDVHEGTVSITLTDHHVILRDDDARDRVTVRYRGLVRGGQLQGVAEFSEVGSAAHGVGTWVLHKDR